MLCKRSRQWRAKDPYICCFWVEVGGWGDITWLRNNKCPLFWDFRRTLRTMGPTFITALHVQLWHSSTTYNYKTACTSKMLILNYQYIRLQLKRVLHLEQLIDVSLDEILAKEPWSCMSVIPILTSDRNLGHCIGMQRMCCWQIHHFSSQVEFQVTN